MTPLGSVYTPTEKLFGLFNACAGLVLQIWIAMVHEPVKETHNLSYEYTNRSVAGRVKNRLKSPQSCSTLSKTTSGSRDGSVGIVTALWVGRQMNHVAFPDSGKGRVSSQSSLLGSPTFLFSVCIKFFTHE